MTNTGTFKNFAARINGTSGRNPDICREILYLGHDEPTGVDMTVTELAAHDQRVAADRDKERRFERRVSKGASVVLLLGFLLGGYSWLGINGMVPLPDWAPMGNIAPAEAPAPDKPVIEMPEGWEPAVPVPDDVIVRGPSTDI